MGDGNALVQRSRFERSNTELVNALHANLSASARAAANRAAKPPHSESHSEIPPYTLWTSKADDTLFIPSQRELVTGLVESRDEYDVTVKLFFLPTSNPKARKEQVLDALALVARELRVESFDLFILSVPGIAFDAEDDADEAGSPYQDEDLNTDLEPILQTWPALENLHETGVIKRVGVSELGTSRLARLLSQIPNLKPAVNQVNIRDCCVVPKPLSLLAKKEGIELLTHNDCTNILPVGTIRELLGPAPAGMSVLAEKHDSANPEALVGQIEPQFVVKYTAVIKDRGVIENKGYFAVAQFSSASQCNGAT